MNHRVAGKHLNRSTAHRRALRKNFTVSLLRHERVTTTLAKAKALRPHIEKIITLGKQKDLARVRRAVALLQDKAIVAKLFDELGPRYRDRQGGYVRIMRLAGYRIGDGGDKAIIELVDNNVLEQKLEAARAEQEQEVEAEATANA
ncbi:MAG: 50S ribosomal protein L17 [Planctomycetota bacterium]|nr:50S ribosomal protein L17 [Planctomycetota bacterium]